MRKRLLSILSAVILVMAITIPFAVPAMAANEPIFTSVIRTGSIPGSTSESVGTFQVDHTYNLTFTGTNLTNPTTVVFADSNLQVQPLTYNYGGAPNSFTVDVFVPGIHTHGMKEFTGTNSNGQGPIAYNLFSIASTPGPLGTENNSQVGAAIRPYWDEFGNNPVGPLVHEGDVIYYGAVLTVNAVNDYGFYGGQLCIQFPDRTGFHPTGGYGAATSHAPQIPEVTFFNNDIKIMCKDPYTVNATHLALGGGVLRATLAYGPHAINLSQKAGFQEGNSITLASASPEYTLGMYGELEVTKAVNLSGAPGTGVTQDFTINVVSSNGTTVGTHTFNLVNGSITGNATWVLGDLAPGAYSVIEVNPGPNWSVSGTGDVQINSGNTTAKTVTNTLRPGHLQVTKWIDLNGASGTGINENFIVTVYGPSYPGGYPHTFVLTNGAVEAPNPWTLQNLLPGNYSVLETTPGGSWISSGGGGVEVLPNQTAQSVVTNDWAAPHTTVVSVNASPSIIPVTGADITITVRDSNDGFVNIFNPYFDLTGTPPFSMVPTFIYPTGVEIGDGDVIFEPGEIWIFSITVHVDGDTQFYVLGHGAAGSTTGPDVTGPDEDGYAEVHHVDVPGVSYTGIGALIAGLAMALIVFGWKRRKQVKL